jgi:hypothetical protein
MECIWYFVIGLGMFWIWNSLFGSSDDSVHKNKQIDANSIVGASLAILVKQNDNIAVEESLNFLNSYSEEINIVAEVTTQDGASFGFEGNVIRITVNTENWPDDKVDDLLSEFKTCIVGLEEHNKSAYVSCFRNGKPEMVAHNKLFFLG